ncbi:MAG TPA: methyltransferase domain-containing protein [Dehalococcoidia bacterium]|nr:methyltransferase domain-containing protein [Dehalococcoidia bacterium]
MDDRGRRTALHRYRFFAPCYDAVDIFNRRLREEAVARLSLAPGDSVIDVGCGTGLSFGLLHRAVGPRGRIMGVELSPDMLARARERVGGRGWRNVTLIQAAAQDAEISGRADAALFFFTHDILQSEAALANVLSHVEAGGRVVTAGGKRGRWWQLPANLALLAYWPFVTTTEGVDQPWAKLQRFVPGLQVEERLLGAAYIAWGEKPDG